MFDLNSIRICEIEVEEVVAVVFLVCFGALDGLLEGFLILRMIGDEFSSAAASFALLDGFLCLGMVVADEDGRREW